MKLLFPLLKYFLLLYFLVLVNCSGVGSGNPSNKTHLPDSSLEIITPAKRNPLSLGLAASYSLAAFHDFMKKFSKTYSSISEYRNRYNIFRKNVRKMAILRGSKQETLDLDFSNLSNITTNLSDRTKAEIKKILWSTKQPSIQRNINKIHKLEVGFCPGSPRPFSIDLAKVKPFPVIIATGQTVTINFKVTLNSVIPKGSTVSLKIQKHETWLPNIPIPCLEVEGLQIGSCKYEADFLLENAAPVLCPEYFPPGQECKLPLLQGVYGGTRPLVVGPIREVPAVIADLLANGEYDAKATVRTAEGELFACVFVKVRLTHR